jgi:hypothetical protein
MDASPPVRDRYDGDGALSNKVDHEEWEATKREPARPGHVPWPASSSFRDLVERTLDLEQKPVSRRSASLPVEPVSLEELSSRCGVKPERASFHAASTSGSAHGPRPRTTFAPRCPARARGARFRPPMPCLRPARQDRRPDYRGDARPGARAWLSGAPETRRGGDRLSTSFPDRNIRLPRDVVHLFCAIFEA